MSISRAERARRKHWIYFLRCPWTGEVKYIGRSCKPEERIRSHLSEKTNARKAEWISSLEPGVFCGDVILGPLCDEDAARAEAYLIIRHLIAYGDRLVNGDDQLRFRFGLNSNIIVSHEHGGKSGAERRTRTTK